MKANGSFILIDSSKISQILAIQNRQYLTGTLKKPQELPYVSDDKVEIGISNYATHTTEAPHWHTVQREYQYMLAGRTRYQEVISGRQHEFKIGDFYAILPQVCFTQESDPGTTILFIKHPSIDDKMTCSCCRYKACLGRRESFVSDKEAI